MSDDTRVTAPAVRPTILETGQRQLADLLNAVPYGASGAIVAAVDSEDRTVSLGVAGRVGDRWTVGGEVRATLDERPDLRAVVRYTWP